MKFVDSHCHLNYFLAPESASTPSDLVKRAELAGVERMLTIATEVATFPDVQKISEEFEAVYHTVGVHPHEASEYRSSFIPTIEKAAAHPKCRGIGELGLDYFYHHSDPQTQRVALTEQLELAAHLKLPAVIHSRDAESDLMPILEKYAKALASGVNPGVIHCFTGTEAFGRFCLDLGFYISFSGILTFKNSEPLRDCAKVFPLNRLLVETDAPYLAPLPHRGKKCEPAMVTFTAQKLAEVKGLSIQEVAQATTQNAFTLFRL